MFLLHISERKGGMKMKRAIALLLAAAMAITILASCGTNEKQAYLNAMIEGTGFSGVVLVTKNGKTVCESAKGTENKFSNKKITADTKFCIGSVSKQFAAAAILLLRQDGQLSVVDKLSKYFPDYRYGNELTIRHLLDMRSGIREFYDVEYIDDAFTELPTGELRGVITNDNTVEENREILGDWLLRQPLEFEPDTAFEYSNSNYFLLARIVEIVSGQSYNEFLRERIFKPLGMTHTTFIDDVDLFDQPDMAQPTVTPQTVYVGVTMGLGDMISNARDIDRWLTSLKTHELLDEESVDMMITDYTNEDDDDDEEEENYGFGIRPCGDGLFHSGYFSTYLTMVFTDPETGFNVFAVTNDDTNPNIDISEIGWNLIDGLDI